MKKIHEEIGQISDGMVYYDLEENTNEEAKVNG